MLEDVTGAEETEFFGTIGQDPEPLEEHIRAGGTVASFLTAWRTKRDEAALLAAPEEMTPLVRQAILNAPLADGNYWGRDGATIRDYLVELLARLWQGEATPKFGMVGESDWQYDLYVPLYQLGLIPGWRDGYGIGYRTDGTDHPEDQTRAEMLIVGAIGQLGKTLLPRAELA